jgi:hypothetical protein
VGLTVNVVGGGNVGVNPPGALYAPGSPVQLTATHAPSWVFDHWEGSLSGTANPATLVMDGNKIVTAVFLADCNNNGFADVLDLSAGTSADCNANSIPDECDRAACDDSSWCSDCNGNGILDACDLIGTFEATSPDYSPLGYPTVQTFTLVNPPAATGDVSLSFNAFGDLLTITKHVSITLNGQAIGTIYGRYGFFQCAPDQIDTLVVPLATYNALKASGGGNVAIAMTPSSNMNATKCGSTPTYIRVTVTYGKPPHSLDADNDGIPDECQSPHPCAGDMNCDGATTFADIDGFVEALSGESAWTGGPCAWLNGDTNADGGVTFADIDGFVARIGTTCP